MGDYAWHVPVREVPPRPFGRLVRAHSLGDPVKWWVDERGFLFEIDYRSGGKIWLGCVAVCTEA
jgi:hypothetical protein